MLRNFLNTFRPGRLDADLDEEIAYHQARSSGAFGSATRVKEEMRDASINVFVETVAHDIRFGLRQWKRSPGIVVLAFISLALGIGVNTAIFTLIKAVTMQQLPVRDPAKLVLFFNKINTGTSHSSGFGADEFSYPFWQYLRRQQQSFTGLCAFKQGNDRVVMHQSQGPWERATIRLVSGNYFEVLGVDAARGRVLRDTDEQISASPVAVISYPFWVDHFRKNRAAVGQTVVLNEVPVTIVGVAAPAFFGERIENAPDFWLPLTLQPQILRSKSYLDWREMYWLNFMGRLRPGTTIASAQAASKLALHQFFLAQAPTKRKEIEAAQITLNPGGGGISGLRFRYGQPLRLLMGIVVVVLLIACANVATLLLARASKRRPEFVARLALGASRTRLLRQVLIESLALSLVSGGAGVLVAWWSTRLLTRVLAISHSIDARPDLPVLSFTLSVAVFAGLLFGILPAFDLSRADLRAVRFTQRFARNHILIAFQVSLSLLLLFSGALMARSLLALEHQDTGFHREKKLLVRSDAALANYHESELGSLYRRLDEQVHSVSGTLTRFTPVSGHSSSGNYSIENFQPQAGMSMDVYDVAVGPGFLESLGVRLIRGRFISARDTEVSKPVAVVNLAFVRKYFPGRDPLGQHMSHGDPFKAPGDEIVGVAADSRYYDVREPAPPMVFYPLAQKPSTNFECMIPLRGDPQAATQQVRRLFRQFDSRLPILETTTLEGQIEDTLQQQTLLASLGSAFGILALSLTAVGIYGAIAYAAAERTNEIGIRMAIGAQRSSVVWLIGRDSLKLLGAGLVIGLPIALLSARLLGSFLYDTTAFDGTSIVLSVMLITAVSMLAAYLPADRASRIDPMQALRHE